VTSYDLINISAIKEKVIEKVALLDESKQYMLFTYANYLSDFVTFDEFCFVS
jgi:hypothetical protein